MTGINWITIPGFSRETGYTEDAVRTKIKKGVWLQDRVWKKAPDGRVLISIEGYERWVEGQESVPPVGHQ